MALSTFWTACLSDWTDRQVVTCVGGLLYLTTGWLVVMSVIYLETQKMNSTIVASHVELWMGWMNQDPCSCFCRQHTDFWLAGFLNDWFTDWTCTLTVCLASTEYALYETGNTARLLCFLYIIKFFPIQPECWNTLGGHGVCELERKGGDASTLTGFTQLARTPNLKNEENSECGNICCLSFSVATLKLLCMAFRVLHLVILNVLVKVAW